MARFTILDYAEEVLKKADKPLLYTEIWERGAGSPLEQKVALKGKTPWSTLGARLFVDVRDNPASRFIKVGKNPARFFLRSREQELPRDIVQSLQKEEVKEVKTEHRFLEKDLHPLLAYFAYSNISFNKGKGILTKTILHEKSKRKGLNEWVHPDMVGVYIPIDDWSPKLMEFSDVADSNIIKLYSFELKRSIDKSNYREYFFQTVSNSSWANEGYLVTAELKTDEDLKSELERLSTTFGIGIIKLDLEDIESSEVLFPAKPKKSLEWELMNKLCDQNPNFEEFLDNITKDFKVKRYTRDKYDDVLEDVERYMADNFKV